jgi:serine/threonine protein kinase
MQHIHAAKVVHGDLKPGNIFLVNGEPKISDFGLSRCDGSDWSHLIPLKVGTLDYMAPEIFAGQIPGPAADVWAFAMLCYATISGNDPWSWYTTSTRDQFSAGHVSF